MPERLEILDSLDNLDRLEFLDIMDFLVFLDCLEGPPKEFLCKSYFSPILRNGLETDL